METKPLPEQAFVAARLRRMALELVREAEALEATLPARPKRVGQP